LVTATPKAAKTAANSHFPTFDRRGLSFIDELHRFFDLLFSSRCSRTLRAARSPVLSSRDTRRKSAFFRIVSSAGEIDLE
jgi:hypothetical protein